MEERDYFYKLTDEEIWKMIDELSPPLQEIFKEEVVSGRSHRHALFIAKSFDPRYGRGRT